MGWASGQSTLRLWAPLSASRPKIAARVFVSGAVPHLHLSLVTVSIWVDHHLTRFNCSGDWGLRDTPLFRLYSFGQSGRYCTDGLFAEWFVDRSLRGCCRRPKQGGSSASEWPCAPEKQALINKPLVTSTTTHPVRVVLLYSCGAVCWVEDAIGARPQCEPMNVLLRWQW
eukprot:COSAG03_NODE_1489_length_3988_cov_2.468758_1_plen_170_part_00